MEFSDRILQLTAEAEAALAPVFKEMDEVAYRNSARVLDSYRRHRVSETMFAGSTGYGYGDTGRDAMGDIYADVFGMDIHVVDEPYSASLGSAILGLAAVVLTASGMVRYLLIVAAFAVAVTVWLSVFPRKKK